MIVEERDEPSKGKAGKRFRRIAIAKCDECLQEFLIERCVKYKLTQQFHFCSSLCQVSSQKSGVLKHKSIETFRQNLGVDYPMQSEKVKEASKINCIERYGVSNPAKLESQKFQTKRTNLARLGVEVPAQSKIVQDKTKQTCLDRFGLECPLLQSEIQEKAWSPEAYKKGFATKKRNKSFHKSKGEDELFKLLCEKFGVDNVERQIVMNERWPIDCYVKTTNTYIQYDGEYWHGRTKSRTEIEKSTLEQDKAIFQKMLTDERQNQWFDEMGLKLFRVYGK